ncbi:MAG: ImmA/IrrE family metallo-endopeptidase [Cetobacterium sp.]|uniref:ImmA/IrrE family metallo-endopeptidase n=1 Tax=uncultured Cetobacterium sp. TaxID=527638 RepID=UPI0025D3EA7C|nr:ImmA/IrrE family metallo-endopeptidase [uncultured Cetobacterium sp.]
MFEKKEISDLVNKLLETNGMSTMPLIDLDLLLKSEGIKLFKFSKSEWKDKNFPDASAILLKSGNEKIIIINEQAHKLEEDKIFTIAHEIGHFFLHTTEEKPYVLCRHGQSGDKEKEDEADYFAACLLMPEKIFKELVNKVEIPSVKVFAKIFGVSETTTRKRFSELNIFCVD